MSVYYDKGMSCLFYICNVILIGVCNQTELALRGLILLTPALPLTDGGDMDARDFVRMQYERRLREGLEDTSGHSQTIGSFERFTKVRRWLILLK